MADHVYECSCFNCVGAARAHKILEQFGEEPISVREVAKALIVALIMVSKGDNVPLEVTLGAVRQDWGRLVMSPAKGVPLA